MRLSILFILSLIAKAAYCQINHLPAKDETGEEPSLVKFVADLKKAVKEKNQDYVLSVIDEEMLYSFGSSNSKEEFKKYWDFASDTTYFWDKIDKVLSMGGVFTNQDSLNGDEKYQFVFPYVFMLDLDDSVDFFHIAVITGKRVNLREKPSLQAKVVAQLNYDIVWYTLEPNEHIDPKITYGMNQFYEPAWWLVETYDRKLKGWVNWKYIYSPIDYRLFLSKYKDGKWKITGFVGGD